MKVCYSCSDKPIKNGVYKAHTEKVLTQYFPKDFLMPLSRQKLSNYETIWKSSITY